MAKKSARTVPATQIYTHPDATAPMRPEVGTQAQFRKKLPPTPYRYDSSLAPQLQWDGGNAKARDDATALIKTITDAGMELAALAAEPAADDKAAQKRLTEIAQRKSEIDNVQARLARLSAPFLEWAEKAERLSFDVPTLPPLVHNRFAGTTSAPFEPGDHRQIAAKVIDDRGNELLVVKDLKEKS